MHVRTIGLARLRRTRKTVTPETQVLVDYYYVSDVRRVLAGRVTGIYPIALDYDPGFIERVTSLPLGSSVLLLFYESSLKETGTLLAIDALLDRVKDRTFKVAVKSLEECGPHREARAIRAMTPSSSAIGCGMRARRCSRPTRRSFCDSHRGSTSSPSTP